MLINHGAVADIGRVVCAFDLLELDGADVRSRLIEERASSTSRG
jgi:hypothetical protein